MKHSALLSLMLLTGCTMLQPVAQLEVSVDELARNHRYNSALAALQRGERDQPDYREHRRELLAAARNWERQLLNDLDQLIASQQFAAAQLQLERAMPELPETPALRRYAANFYEQRDRFINEQMDTLARLRGENLVREQPLYEKLRGVEGDYRVQDAVERYREDAEYFAGKLRDAGLRAYQTSDWSEAVALLTIANQLHPDAFTATHLSNAEEQLRAAQSEEQSEQRQRERARRIELRNRFDSAMKTGDLDVAAATVETAAQQIDANFARPMQQRLAAAQQDAAATDLAAGDRLYGEGKVEQALRHWQRAQRFDKSAELQVKIDRAQRLLEHYRELREQSQSR